MFLPVEFPLLLFRLNQTLCLETSWETFSSTYRSTMDFVYKFNLPLKNEFPKISKNAFPLGCYTIYAWLTFLIYVDGPVATSWLQLGAWSKTHILSCPLVVLSPTWFYRKSQNNIYTSQFAQNMTKTLKFTCFQTSSLHVLQDLLHWFIGDSISLNHTDVGWQYLSMFRSKQYDQSSPEKGLAIKKADPWPYILPNWWSEGSAFPVDWGHPQRWSWDRLNQVAPPNVLEVLGRKSGLSSGASILGCNQNKFVLRYKRPSDYNIDDHFWQICRVVTGCFASTRMQ